MSDESNEYELAGDLLSTGIDVLADALSDPEWRVRNGGDELELRAPGASVAIYQSKPAEAGIGIDYLVSGRLHHDLASSTALVDRIAARLRARGVVYNFELADLDGNEVHVARDPRF